MSNERDEIELKSIIDRINKSSDSDIQKRFRIAGVKDEYARKKSLVDCAKNCNGNCDE